MGQESSKKNNFKVATMSELSDFNDAKRNLRGERFRVLLAETSQAGEGVQFRHVRHVHLIDVPTRHSDLVQRTSRCVRLGGHSDLPEEERTISVQLHVAQLPKFLKQGPGSFIYRELQADAKLIELLTETALEQLGDTSTSPARPFAMALWRLHAGGDDLALLERALLREVKTADERILDGLMDKSAELLPPLEAMRLAAVDCKLLASLGPPPHAPPPRSEASRKRCEEAMAELADVGERLEVAGVTASNNDDGDVELDALEVDIDETDFEGDLEADDSGEDGGEVEAEDSGEDGGE